MNRGIKRIFSIFAAALMGLSLASIALAGEGHHHGHDHEDEDHTDEHHDEPAKGPHGGKMLTHDDFGLEVTIFETGVPPQYRLYAYDDGEPVKPGEVKASIALTRFGGKKDEFQFIPEGEYLTSKDEVKEPHSFEVSVTASYDGETYSWQYDSFEGRTELSDEALEVAKLGIETAGPHGISSVTRVYGRLIPNEDKVAHVIPRFPGIVREVKKSLGDKVEKGETLAVVESNQSLQPYEIRSMVDGVVIKRHATLGEFVSESREIFVVADLSEIWAEFQVYRDDFGPIEKGQEVTIDLGDGVQVAAKVNYVSPVTDEATQSKLIRAVLPNPSGSLRPGLFVSGVLAGAETKVPVAVKRSAIQTFRDWNVVYLTDGHIFQAMPVELGRRDTKYIEIISGIAEGDRYVSENSFIVKADIEKSGASHDH